ncbi:hypothetical protein HOY80DRAFT_955595 [Tuber brumale]|nr:hypothetical protein HOY80DRAFT_955595 [Tuber brumale]
MRNNHQLRPLPPHQALLRQREPNIPTTEPLGIPHTRVKPADHDPSYARGIKTRHEARDREWSPAQKSLAMLLSGVMTLAISYFALACPPSKKVKEEVGKSASRRDKRRSRAVG